MNNNCVASVLMESKLINNAQGVFSCLDSINCKVNAIDSKLFSPQPSQLCERKEPVLDNLEDIISAMNQIVGDIYNKIDKIQCTI